MRTIFFQNEHHKKSLEVKANRRKS